MKNTIGVAIFFCTILLLNYSYAEETVSSPFRIGFSSSMFTDVNENDAKAATKIWAQMLIKEQNLPLDPDPLIFKDIDTMLLSMQSKQLACVSILVTEYDRFRRTINFDDQFFVSYNSGSITEKYILIVHQNNSVKSLADLRGKTLNLQIHSRMCIAPLWLDILLIKQGYPDALHFAGKINRETKLSKVILPVFFRKADACLVTRKGFETMSELNPQMSKQLTVIAESPEIVPVIFAFRADYMPNYIEKIYLSLKTLQKTPAGQQVLTIFQADKLDLVPSSCIDTALEVISSYEKLIGNKQKP
ncbi:MAG: PhnD/SsuA/transferrin family substrate-binding protein [Desulfobacterales bacterium]|nr:PhnD/SsuA/transferrin family substrate-binding protein [Desulfobacterales bacterium]